jgi:folate-binding protein YgfZ
MPPGPPLSLPPADTTPLRTGAVAFDLTGRGSLRVFGPDRVAFLQGVVTNDVRALAPGSGCPALFLTPKGKLRATLDVLALEDCLLLDTEPALAGPLAEGLRSYIVYPPVGLEDLTTATGVLHVEGPSTASLLGSALGPLPSKDRDHVPFSFRDIQGRIVSVSRGGETGFDLRIPSEKFLAMQDALAGLGLPPAPVELLDAARIEAGIPRWGAELDQTVLPDEAGLQATAVSYSKGCYVGQETVARLRTYGHVNRILRRLLLPPDSAPAPGDAVLAPEGDGKEWTAAGRIVDAVRSARLGRVVAFAWLKRDFAVAGQTFEVSTASGTVPAEILGPPRA